MEVTGPPEGRRERAFLLPLLLAGILIVGVTSALLLMGNGPGRTRSFQVYSDSAGSTNGLTLTLSLNTTSLSSGQEVSVVVDEANQDNHPVEVAVASRWALPGLSLSPCGPGGLPFGIEIVSGYYTKSNVSGAQPLTVNEPGAIFSCPAIYILTSYIFEPASDSAAVYGSCSPNPCFTFPMTWARAVGGYWTGQPSGASFSEFPQGEYTVVAGDEWGAVTVLHFVVTSPTAVGSGAGGLGIDLVLRQNASVIREGQRVNVSAHVQNALPYVNNLTGADSWASPIFRSWLKFSLCPSYLYIALLQGRYTESNLSAATPLQTSPPDMVVPCPAFRQSYYLMEPMSDRATFFGGEAVLPMGIDSTFVGYYVGSQAVAFQPGTYTIVAGDEWGQMAISYFQVVS